jgi:two-component system chemotaxis sensor kinase CheA
MLQPSEQAISTIHGRQEMAMVRGTLLPVIRLHQRFHVEPRHQHPWESLLIVAESGAKLFCLMVDELIGKQEVVIKSLGEGMRNIAGVAGGAILGDGRVGLILDPEGLFGSGNRANHGE